MYNALIAAAASSHEPKKIRLKKRMEMEKKWRRRKITC